MPVASVLHENVVAVSGGVLSGPLTITSTGNLVLAVVFRLGSNTQYPASLTGPTGTWVSAIGTLGTAGEEVKPNTNSFFMSAYYGYTNVTGAQTISVTFNGSTPGTAYLFLVECGDIASINAIISSIAAYQAALAPGTNVITVAGGTGSNNVATQPALVMLFSETTAGSITASAGYVQNWSSAARGIDSIRLTTTGSFNSTATLNTSTGTVSSFQIVVAEQSSSSYTIGEVLNGSFSGASGSQAMTTACNLGDLILVVTEAENVSGLVNVPVTDTVNFGSYQHVASFYPGSGNTCMNIVFIACTSSGIVPTIVWANTGTYSNAIFQIIRMSGFASTPVLDVASILQATGTGTAVSNTTTFAQPNELTFSINLYGNPVNVGSQNAGWTDTGVSGQGSLRNQYYQGGVTGSQTFTVNESASGTWYNYLFGFYSGVTIVGAQGAFALTGEAAIFTLGQLVVGSGTLLANPGAFDWIGAQAQIPAILQPTFGSFFLNGQNVNLISSSGATFALNCATGFFVLTGIDAVLQGSVYTMTDDTGFFTLTGFAAGLIPSAPIVVPPGYEVLPNLVGLDWLTASAILWYGGFAELQPEIVKGTPIQMIEGIVTGQTPAAYTVVPIGCAVTLSVASSNLLSVSFEKH